MSAPGSWPWLPARRSWSTTSNSTASALTSNGRASATARAASRPAFQATRMRRTRGRVPDGGRTMIGRPEVRTSDFQEAESNGRLALRPRASDNHQVAVPPASIRSSCARCVSITSRMPPPCANISGRVTVGSGWVKTPVRCAPCSWASTLANSKTPAVSVRPSTKTTTSTSLAVRLPLLREAGSGGGGDHGDGPATFLKLTFWMRGSRLSASSVQAAGSIASNARRSTALRRAPIPDQFGEDGWTVRRETLPELRVASEPPDHGFDRVLGHAQPLASHMSTTHAGRLAPRGLA